MNTTTPRWQDLLAKLIHQDHHEAPASEVELYQAQPALGLDLGIAWSEALLPGQLLAEEEPRVSARFPASWNAARHVTLAAPFPCCIGMAPQFLQKIDAIMENAEAFFQQETVGMPMLSADITLDNKTPLSQMAIARLAGDANQIERLIPQLDGELLQKNERAAQLWFAGRLDEAREAWDNLDGENPVIAFNQGLAAMATGDVERGRECLAIAVEGFPESTGWHHLAELYLAVAD
ncbi:MAG TPA: hypothetical protein PLN21_13335 [Gemmatales bacterium]|nr:hypothetical protein [Gemmatales bacterium]